MSDFPQWLTFERTSLPCYRAVRVEYIGTDDPRNNGSVNAYVKCLDKAGNYKAAVKVWQDWSDDRAAEYTKIEANAPEFNGEKFGATFYMSGDSSFDPNKGQAGPYAIYADGASDKVKGLGLPLRRHVQYLITLQWMDEETPPQLPDPPTGKQWNIVEQSATRVVLEWK